MNEVLGYARINRGRPRTERRSENDHSSSSDPGPPADRWNILYLTLFMAGVGFFLPYNSFIMAVDYFQHHYPASTIMFDMSTVYILTAFVTVICNNILLEMFSLKSRIFFGHGIIFTVLMFVAFVEIGWGGFEQDIAYRVNLAAIVLVAIGCTIQQSSYYGFTSILPPRYTQAVMAGESAAGCWVCVDRIITKLSVSDEKTSTILFFLLTIIYTICQSGIYYIYTMENPVVHYYTLLHEESRKRIVLRPTEDAGLIDLECSDLGRQNYGVLKLQLSTPLTGNSVVQEDNNETETDLSQSTAFSFANPVYEPNSTRPITEERVRTGPSYKVEDVLVTIPNATNTRSKTWKGIKRGLIARWHVAQTIYPYMVSIGLAYFVTLSLYPGIVSEIISCNFESWMPIIVLSAFNVADLLGKMAASIPYSWTRSQLLMMGSLRTLLIPLLLLCATPRGAPHIQGEVYPIIFSIALGFSNGIVGSVPMIQAPSRVRDEHRELTGNIMTLSYNVGLTGGSLVAYLLEGMLGPQVQQPCTLLYPTPTLPTKATLATKLVETTIATVTTQMQNNNLTTWLTNTMFSMTPPTNVESVSQSTFISY